jgi:hypothetical protein
VGDAPAVYSIGVVEAVLCAILDNKRLLADAAAVRFLFAVEFRVGAQTVSIACPAAAEEALRLLDTGAVGQARGRRVAIG